MTTFFHDYDQILLDARAAVETANMGFSKVMADANDRDYVIQNMPLCDLRIRRSTPDALGGQNYYGDIVIEAEITTFDVTSLRDAAKMRNDLAGKLQKFFQANPHFSGSSDTVIVGNAEFGTGEDPKAGAFMAAVVMEFHVKLYSDV
jgi:hypothetical protein